MGKFSLQTGLISIIQQSLLSHQQRSSQLQQMQLREQQMELVQFKQTLVVLESD